MTFSAKTQQRGEKSTPLTLWIRKFKGDKWIYH